ncbi:PREDICTED: betaine--homocysteine S-methyltransferase 1-like [Amphimedon queenslandica]|nr:PREDICTED: betaine--homocysteine S-methyltransferase 1-like [Amphimedon queenslandica]|eukprot:XP_003391573.1 PREDICTED: betaine--homocysteine S-methyltransferase 1-like [Amphimedon queenslandica]
MASRRLLKSRGLQERLNAGESILCAEGYLLALSRRGYITHGVWVPEFILEDPAILKSVHYEMAHAGSDVIEAFQYNTHREKMKQIGREDDIEKINRTALKIAREVAEEKNLLFAGGISNTNQYVKGETEEKVRAMFEEQVRWSKEEGVDYMIGETFSFLGEAQIALEVIQSFDLPAVVTLTVYTARGEDGVVRTRDGVPIGEACKDLIDRGVTITGVNCTRGPEMTLELVNDIVQVCPPEKIGALPIAYRTTPKEPSFMDLTDSICPANNPVYPRGMEPFCISPVEIESFTKSCTSLGMKYLGICCGNSGELTRTMAETMGRKPPASRYLDHTQFGFLMKLKMSGEL